MHLFSCGRLDNALTRLIVVVVVDVQFPDTFCLSLRARLFLSFFVLTRNVRRLDLCVVCLVYAWHSYMPWPGNCIHTRARARVGCHRGRSSLSLSLIRSLSLVLTAHRE